MIITCSAIEIVDCCPSCHDDYLDYDIEMPEVSRKDNDEDWADVCCKKSGVVYEWGPEEWEKAKTKMEQIYEDLQQEDSS